MSDPVVTKTRGWIKVVLVLSLALNLAVIGVIGGFMMRGPSPMASSMFPVVEGYRAILRSLNDEQRDLLREDMRNLRPEFRERRREMRNLHAEVLAAIRADPFSEDQLGVVLEKQRTLIQDLGETAQGVLIEQVARMSQEERATFADNLEAEMKRPKPNRRFPAAERDTPEKGE